MAGETQIHLAVSLEFRQEVSLAKSFIKIKVCDMNDLILHLASIKPIRVMCAVSGRNTNGAQLTGLQCETKFFSKFSENAAVSR